MQLDSIVARFIPAASGEEIWFQPDLSVSWFDGVDDTVNEIG